MKIRALRRLRGFTLVEILVVITIIAVLASASFAGLTLALDKAKKVKALAVETSIESAVNDFYREYGTMPTTNTGNTDQTLDTKNDPDFLNILLGTESGNSPINTRAIKFLSVKEGKGNKDGMIYGTGSPPPASGLYDPWGSAYHVILDLDADEQVEVPGASGKQTLNNRRVAVWSDGKDKKPNTADDVKTW